MTSLKDQLQLLSERGTPVGSHELRDRVMLELASQRASRVGPDRADLGVGVRLGWRRFPGWMYAGASAAVVVLLVGASVWLSSLAGEGPQPVITQPLITQPTTPAPTTTPRPDPPTTIPAGGVWQRVGVEVMDPVVGLFDMTEADSRLVAVGFDPGADFRQDGVIFVSEDGLTWTRLAENDPALTTGTVLMYGITEGGPGLVAVGMSCEDNPCEASPYPTVWTSVDGNAWTRSPNEPDVFGTWGAIEDVVATDHGIVAAGWLAGSDADDVIWSRPAVWLSPDGAEWTRVWEGERVSGSHAFLGAVAVSPDGVLVAVGSGQNELDEPVAAVWTSTDAHLWERVEPNSPAFGDQTDPNILMPVDVAWGSSGFIAVGGQGGSQVAIWHSPDGRSWTRIETADQPFGTGGTLGSVAALQSGFVAAGPGFDDFNGPPVPPPVTLWTSVDGSTWNWAGELGSGSALAIVVTDLRIAVAGQTITGGFATAAADDYHAAVWQGPTLDPSAPPPEPLQP